MKSHAQRSINLYHFLQRSTPSRQQASSAVASTQPSLLRGSATATAIAANFTCSNGLLHVPVGGQRGGAASSHCERPHSQPRLHTSPTSTAARCQVRPSGILVDEPARQRCAAHARATAAAIATRRAQIAMKSTTLPVLHRELQLGNSRNPCELLHTVHAGAAQKSHF